jgi:hypothetical protein
MTKLKKGFFHRPEAVPPPPVPPASVSAERLIDLMRCFPIGGKLRYYPEHRKDIVLESIVIAYGVNNQLVYTQNDIQIDADDGSLVFLLDDNWMDRVVREVHQFCLLIPYVAPSQNDLDYVRRAALETGGYLQRGETLTLMSLCNARGVPHVNCTVRKRVLMKEGYYANHAMVVLELQADTLDHVDQRQQMRLRTHIPVTVKASETAPDLGGTLVDFSESSLRIRLNEGTDPLADRKGLIATIDLSGSAAPGQAQRFVFAGKVLRRDDDCVVLGLTGRLKQNRFRDMELMDSLDLKASLLQHPATEH